MFFCFPFCYIIIIIFYGLFCVDILIHIDIVLLFYEFMFKQMNRKQLPSNLSEYELHVMLSGNLWSLTVASLRMDALRQLFATYLYPLIESFVLNRITNDSPKELESYRYSNNNNNNNNEDILFFIHGFPDNHTLWNKQIEYFKNKNYLCYTITLPNYNSKNIDYKHKYGYDWNIISKLIANKLIKISKENNNNNNITLIMHDFGTIYGYMAYKILLNNNIDIIKNMVFIDVGDGLDSNTNTFQLCLFLMYHWYLLFTFFLPNFIGKWFIFFLCYIPGSPLCRNWQINQITNYMNYSYFHLWRRRLNIGGYDINCDDLTIWNMPNNVDIFFGFGKRFSIKFHTQRWKQYLKSNKTCFYKGYDAGHWLMIDQSHQFNHDLYKWLNHKTNQS